MVSLLEAAPGFDAAKGNFRQFASVVIKRKVLMIQRRLSAKKRGRGRTLSILDCPDPVLDSVLGREYHAERDLAVDVATEIERLPEDLRRIAELVKSHSVAKAAELLKVHRTTIRRKQARILERFQRTSLDQYL